MVVRIFALCLALVSLSFSAAADSSSSPRSEMKQTIDDIIKVVEAVPGDDQKEKRRSELRELINPKFSFDEMSRRSMGANWTKLTPEQQQEFTDVFSELLARTYLSKIETVRAGMVAVDSETIEMPKAIVRTTVTSKGDKFPIDYKLMFRDGRWQVYDVIIENIGLVANYRNEFAGIMRRDKFEGLMSRLRQKAGQE